MNPTIAKLALAALAGRRRFWLLLGFPIALVALTVLVRVTTRDAELAVGVLMLLGTTLVMPLLALVAATAVMGPEIDDGSIVYLLAKPVNRYAVAFSKYVVAASATVLLGAVPITLLGWALEPGRRSEWLGVGVAVALAAVTYAALFLALSTVWRHAVVASLLYVLVWEGVLANIFSGAAWLSVQMWSQRVGASLVADVDGPDITLWWALLASALVTVGGVWWSGDRLRSFSLRGDE